MVNVPSNESLPTDLLESLSLYLIEAGIELELSHSCRHMVVQNLFMYFVIEKRKLELYDICTGKFVAAEL
jgi:hypothetical protein